MNEMTDRAELEGLTARDWLPEWMDEIATVGETFEGDCAQVELAIRLARRNVDNQTGGPFGAAVFEQDTGRLVGAAVNRVVPLSSAVLHAEILAFLVVQQRLGRHTLRDAEGGGYVLASSCEPCAMCLGACHWSGVSRIVCAATGEDARRVGFDEGPVSTESFRYLADRGITIVRGLLREEGAEVLEAYAERGGTIYNGATLPKPPSEDPSPII